MDFLDAYIIRARLFPAVLAISPAIALLATSIAANPLNLPQTITTVAIGVIFFAFSDLARRLGKKAEWRLFEGTVQSANLLRRTDKTFDTASQDRYRKLIGDLMGEKAPSAEKERLDPVLANGYYMRASNWLRENTRNHDDFRLLFEENITYGFRRNLFGVKWPALSLNILVIITCAVLLYLNNFSPQAIKQVEMIAIFAAVHAIYFLFAVTRGSVISASDTYARQLVLSSEALSKIKSVRKEMK